MPRSCEKQTPARAVAVVSPETRGVVYLEDEASLEIITAALEAWGLKVRAEREAPPGAAPARTPRPAVETSWETMRPAITSPGRLDNVLSPLWLPIRKPVTGTEPVSAWSWFGRAA
ncbi:MAG TPA: hypothetical protein PKD75_13730 [Tepidiformaceae bacterium]|nr:hypothetical protein [Tepidiformaceae bacterium]